MKGYKVFNPDFTCKGFKYEVGKKYKHEGKIEICQSGFHFCLKASDCFNYYSFDPENIVCEVEAHGEIETKDGDSKVVTSEIEILRIIGWDEVLIIANEGINNTGHSNSGDSNSGNRNSGDSNSGNRNSGISNSGYWNSGDRNSGDRNSGDRNSGYWNSGDRNSGDRNSGDSNSGNSNSGYWNSGDRNSGDSNSGYRNSGAFCTENNPEIMLFNKPSGIKVRDWECSRVVSLMSNLELTLWVPSSHMTEKEKKENPKHETCDGYLKEISIKEAWSNLWGNLSKSDRNEFLELPNFDSKIFEEITGIKI